MLEIKNLHASIAGKEILKGIDLAVNEGEVHAVMGPNVSGKSTIAQRYGAQPEISFYDTSVIVENADQKASAA